MLAVFGRVGDWLKESAVTDHFFFHFVGEYFSNYSLSVPRAQSILELRFKDNNKKKGSGLNTW